MPHTRLTLRALALPEQGVTLREFRSAINEVIGEPLEEFGATRGSIDWILSRFIRVFNSGIDPRDYWCIYEIHNGERSAMFVGGSDMDRYDVLYEEENRVVQYTPENDPELFQAWRESEARREARRTGGRN